MAKTLRDIRRINGYGDNDTIQEQPSRRKTLIRKTLRRLCGAHTEAVHEVYMKELGLRVRKFGFESVWAYLWRNWERAKNINGGDVVPATWGHYCQICHLQEPTKEAHRELLLLAEHIVKVEFNIQ